MRTIGTRWFLAVILLVTATVSTNVLAADDVAAAREHYSKGKRAYDVGHFAEAAKEYELAYQAKDDPALLYNLGQAHRLAGNYPQAMLAYKAYLRNVPEAPNRAEVEARLREMQKTLDQQAKTEHGPPPETVQSATAPPPATTSTTTQPTAAPVAALETTESAPRPKKRTWIWGVVAGAVVAVGLGVGLGISSHDKDPTPTFGAVSAR